MAPLWNDLRGLATAVCARRKYVSAAGASITEPVWAIVRPAGTSLAHQPRAGHTGWVTATAPPMPSGPMLLTPGKPRTGPEWLVEAKLDGARALARVAGGEVTIQSRPGNSFTARFPEIADALACQFDGHTVIVDGELVALDAAGLPNFALLQRRLLTHKPTALHRRTIPARLWLFDCLHLDGHDLTALPYRTRREVLEDLVPSRSGTLAVAPRHGATSTPPRSSRSPPKWGLRARFRSGPTRCIGRVAAPATG